MITRRQEALRRIRAFVLAELGFLGITVLIAGAATGRLDFGVAWGTLTFLFVNTLAVLSYPLWGPNLGSPIGSTWRELRAESDEERFIEHRRRAHAHHDAGRMGAAYTELQRASALRPQDTELLFELAELCAASGKPEAATRYYRKILELGPVLSSPRLLGLVKERLTQLAASPR
jgi:tetratricopeptide (TPR) repeat protein